MNELRLSGQPSKAKPGCSYINLYLHTDLPTQGDHYESLSGARRGRGRGGITVAIHRDANGDFSIERVEEF